MNGSYALYDVLEYLHFMKNITVRLFLKMLWLFEFH